MSTNRIGLDLQKTETVVNKLNDLLAGYQVFYQNLRGFHWNIKGHHFFELHVKFEEFYTDAQVKIDEVAERILTLGKTPHHSYSAYLERSVIKEAPFTHSGQEMVASVLDQLKALISMEREILKAADEAGDDSTADQMTVYLSEQEKLTWMLAAFLG